MPTKAEWEKRMNEYPMPDDFRRRKQQERDRDSDGDLIRHALLMWKNYIETGTVTPSANDAIAAARGDLCRSLDDEQRELVSRIKHLADSQSR